MDRRATIAESLTACKHLLGRYLAGFDDSSRTRQAPGLPNHVAWTLGHLAMTMHRVVEKLDGRSFPETDFVVGASRGDTMRFGTESVAFGSSVIADGAAFPSMARCVAIYDAACDRLAGAVRAAPESKLDETAKWGAGEGPLYLLALRMVFHNGVHTGQIADLRRALGFKSIFA